jgi:hypothetical protein
LSVDLAAQITPFGVRTVDQDELLLPPPVLELLLAGDGVRGDIVRLEVDQAVNVVSCGVWLESSPMLVQAATQVCRYADLESSPVFAAQDVHNWVAVHEQVPPLRFAPVGMTELIFIVIFRPNAFELTTRHPDRSEAEWTDLVMPPALEEEAPRRHSGRRRDRSIT